MIKRIFLKFVDAFKFLKRELKRNLYKIKDAYKYFNKIIKQTVIYVFRSIKKIKEKTFNILFKVIFLPLKKLALNILKPILTLFKNIWNRCLRFAKKLMILVKSYLQKIKKISFPILKKLFIYIWLKNMIFARYTLKTLKRIAIFIYQKIVKKIIIKVKPYIVKITHTALNYGIRLAKLLAVLGKKIWKVFIYIVKRTKIVTKKILYFIKEIINITRTFLNQLFLSLKKIIYNFYKQKIQIPLKKFLNCLKRKIEVIINLLRKIKIVLLSFFKTINGIVKICWNQFVCIASKLYTILKEIFLEAKEIIVKAFKPKIDRLVEAHLKIVRFCLKISKKVLNFLFYQIEKCACYVKSAINHIYSITKNLIFEVFLITRMIFFDLKSHSTFFVKKLYRLLSHISQDAYKGLGSMNSLLKALFFKEKEI